MSTEKEIVNWLNKQHEWVREAAHRLLSKGELEGKDVEELVALAKKPEPKTKDKAPRTFPSIGGSPATGDELRLESMGPVEGIDALNPKKPLEFGGGSLSVVYGSNGSGKSGYTRIISKACGKAHSVELKPNVYEEAPAKQECTFGYSLGGVRKDLTWSANADPVEDLRPVDVFDTECGRIYLENDNELSYEPPELALFSELVEACERVRAALAAEQEKLVSKLPELPTEHANTVAGKAYAALSKDIDPGKLEELVTWKEEDEANRKAQGERVKVADPAGAAKKKQEQKKQIENLRDALEQGANALKSEGIEGIRELKEDAVTKRQAAKDGAAVLSSTTQIEGVGSPTWKALWEAARAFSLQEAYPDKEFPHTCDDAKCVLCQQDLGEEARSRLRGLEEFVKGVLEQEATAAEAKLKEGLESLPTRPTPEQLVTACQAAGLGEDDQKAIEAAWAKLEPPLSLLREGTLPEKVLEEDEGEENEEVSKLTTRLGERATEAGKAAEELEDDAKSPDRQEALRRVAELEGKKWVTDQEKAIRAELVRLKKSAEFDEWKGKTATNGISLKAGKISETLVTEAYVDRFNEELKKLGAQRIKVELVKTATKYGKSKHGIRLRDAKGEKASVATVLSEGERRIVALAAFIADVTGSGKKAPFVFDDPISSLDQIFEEKVIRRLVELSQERQVLVFTHRLSFLGIMNDLAGGALQDVHIRREPWGTGQPGEVPLFGKRPDKALTNIKNDRLVKARKAAEEGYDAYYPLAKAICSDFRILLERIIETVLLADVVQRHRRAVNTMGKIGNLVKIENADCALIDELMTKYSCYEHSQSEEAPVEVPDSEDIEKDIDRMVDWYAEFSNRAV